MVSPLFFYQLTLIALVWLYVMLQWAWLSDATTAQAQLRAETLCGPHHQAALRHL